MARSEISPGFWLGFGGLLVLGLLELTELRAPAGAAARLATLGAYLAVGGGLYLCLAWRRTPGEARLAPASPQGLVPTAPTARADPSERATGESPPAARIVDVETTRAMVAAFQTWLSEQEDEGTLWSSFDQLVRELLNEHIAAMRVRCFRLDPASGGLTNLAGTSTSPAGSEATQALLRHVARTGREYLAGQTPLPPEIAEQRRPDDEVWSWVWPVRSAAPGLSPHETVAGLVAIGRLSADRILPCDQRHALTQLLSVFWTHVETLFRLRIVQKTDKASGVLTRGDFFEIAARALLESYEEKEPVVLSVVALEGLRRLDDTGAWEERDQLVEGLGRLIARRVRTDDVVGRFSDDRFVLLLRRLDGGLGRLIAEKILSTAEEHIGRLPHPRDCVRVRIGLVSSGSGRVPLNALLVKGFDAVEASRHQGLAICETSAQPEEVQADAH